MTPVRMACAVMWMSVLGAPSGAEANGGEWATFLRAPTAKSRERLEAALSSCGSGGGPCAASPKSSEVKDLVQLVGRGDTEAVRVAFMARRVVDGGDLEDLTRSLGTVADVRPRLFLMEVKRHNVPSGILRRIVCSMPEDALDDYAARRAAVAARIEALSRVTQEDLTAVKDLSIVALRRCIVHRG